MVATIRFHPKLLIIQRVHKAQNIQEFQNFPNPQKLQKLQKVPNTLEVPEFQKVHRVLAFQKALTVPTLLKSQSPLTPPKVPKDPKQLRHQSHPRLLKARVLRTEPLDDVNLWSAESLPKQYALSLKIFGSAKEVFYRKSDFKVMPFYLIIRIIWVLR